MSEVGHNSTMIGAERLQSLVQRIERLEVEKKNIAEDIADIFKEVKSAGYDPKIVRRLIRERKESDAEREERETLLEVYRRALAGIADMPLGVAALARVA